MRKEELTALAKELLDLEDLSTRKEDLLLLKREFKRLNGRDDENFYEKQLTEAFFEVYDALAKKEPFLNASSYDYKKVIIEKTKKLLENPNIKTVLKEYDALFLEFKHAGKCSEAQDNELFGEMREIKEALTKKVNEHYASQREMFSSRIEAKKALIEQAKQIVKMDHIKQASEKFDALIEEWKKVGFAGKEHDEELWNELSSFRKELSKKRKAYYEGLQDVFKERANKKEELIKLVKKITADAYFENDEIKQIKDIQNQFKKIGFAGKECDEALNQEFNEACKKYFEEMKFYKL